MLILIGLNLLNLKPKYWFKLKIMGLFQITLKEYCLNMMLKMVRGPAHMNLRSDTRQVMAREQSNKNLKKLFLLMQMEQIFQIKLTFGQRKMSL